MHPFPQSYTNLFRKYIATLILRFESGGSIIPSNFFTKIIMDPNQFYFHTREFV